MIVADDRFEERLERTELVDRLAERLDREPLLDVILGADARLDPLEVRAVLGEERRADELLPARLPAEKLDLDDDFLLALRDFGPAGAASQTGIKSIENMANVAITTKRFNIPNLIMSLPFHHVLSEETLMYTPCL